MIKDQTACAITKKNKILEHLSALESEFKRYFPETTDEDLDFVRNPFKYPVEKDKFLELINDSTARQEYEEKLLLGSDIVLGLNERFSPQNNKKSSSYSYPFCLDLSVRVWIFFFAAN